MKNIKNRSSEELVYALIDFCQQKRTTIEIDEKNNTINLHKNFLRFKEMGLITEEEFNEFLKIYNHLL